MFQPSQVSGKNDLHLSINMCSTGKALLPRCLWQMEMNTIRATILGSAEGLPHWLHQRPQERYAFGVGRNAV